MALAIRLEGLLRQGVVKDYAELARLGRVSRARVSQIANLTLLAPDIQEAILFFPRAQPARDWIRMQRLQPIALERNWRRQRRLWAALLTKQARPSPLRGTNPAKRRCR